MFIALIEKNSLSLGFPQYIISHIFYQEKNERGAIRFRYSIMNCWKSYKNIFFILPRVAHHIRTDVVANRIHHFFTEIDL